MKRFINICIKSALLVPAVFLLSVLGGNAEAQKYVRVTSATTCEAPTAPDIVDVDKDVAMLMWEAPTSGHPNGYEVTYQRNVSGSSPVSVVTQEPEILIENLLPGTYTWSVRSQCGEGSFSEAVQGEEFEIEWSCEVPTALESIVEEQEAMLAWDVPAGVEPQLGYEVVYQRKATGSIPVSMLTKETGIELENLLPGTYTWSVRSQCGEGFYSDAAQGEEFEIEAPAYEGPISVLLAESFNNCTGTNELYSPITKADNPGWTGSKIFADKGAVKMGSSSANGTLTSPTLDLRLQQGIYTVVFFAKSHSATEGKNLQVTSTTENGNVTRDFTLTTEYARYATTFVNGSASTTLSFQLKANTKGRFYIDSVAVYQPAQASLGVNPVSNILYKENEETTRHDTLSVRGALLTQDVTVSCTNDRFEFSPSLLDAEAVMSAEG
ncbi:fibronectin type III domain-containing protein, partial [bacterium]|nr:fibronectin type III domain-containing protein [bacterium]